MTASHEKVLYARVQKIFDKHPNEGYRSRELRIRMNIDDDAEFQALRRVLHAMADDGELLYNKSKGYHRPRSGTNEVTGTLMITKAGMGFVAVPGEDDVYIAKRSLSTAFNGDTVRVALFGGRQSKKNRDENIEGEVIEVVSRAKTEFVGRLEHSRSFYFVICDDPTVPRDFYIAPELLNGAKAGDKVLVAFESWESDHLNPEGRVLSVIGQAGSIHTEIASVIETYHLSKTFPAEVNAEAEALPGKISPKEIAARMDLRDLATMTIDPEDAKDFDDALSIERIDADTFRLGVHIADVSAYVKPGTALDKEAFERGTSVYLANQVVPMLPERISNNLCSLVPLKDRLAFTCFMTVSKKGTVKDYKIVHTIIRSKRRFSYEAAEAVLNDRAGDYADELLDLWMIASALRAKRMKNGAVDFDSPEAKFHYDEHGKPVDIKVKVRLKSHQLVEECMLLANRTVAEHIGKTKKEEAIRPFVYRVHDLPDKEKLKELALFVKKFGYTLNVSGSVSSKDLQKLLSDAHGSKEENVINEVAIRSMAKAVYTDKNIGHFGLSFDHYTHFTSPIRRYPDLMVHRLLDEYAHGITPARREELVKRLPTECKWCSDRERVAMEAERASVKVMQVEYMRDRIGEVYEAVVSGVAPYGLFIEVNDVLVEGLLHMRNLDDDYYRYDEKMYSIVGDRRGREFRLGDAIRVVVKEVDVSKRMIDFALAPEEKSSKPLPHLKAAGHQFVKGKQQPAPFVRGKKDKTKHPGRSKNKGKRRHR